MSKKLEKQLYKIYFMVALIFMTTIGTSMTVFAEEDPLAVVNNLSDFIFAIIRGVGVITLGFGALQIGMGLKSHDPSQRVNGVLSLVGGIIITFAKPIINMLLK